MAPDGIGGIESQQRPPLTPPPLLPAITGPRESGLIHQCLPLLWEMTGCVGPMPGREKSEADGVIEEKGKNISKQIGDF
ncbi:hypothetical protein TNCV_348991 [Trichonephila clavipes]|nr:hypothetical protein TNCV_348991 [Trichonephila clavipes]